MKDIIKRLDELSKAIGLQSEPPEITGIEFWKTNEDGSSELIEAWAWSPVTGKYELAYEPTDPIE